MADRQPVYLLDASIYIFRNYFAMPDAWHNDQGYSLNAVFGYTQFLLRMLEQLRPQRIVAAFDESLGQCFRNDIYSEYKSSRALPDESLAFQLKACRRVSELVGIQCYAHSRYEADDLIATIARQMRRSGRPICIISRDKDLAQLLKYPGDCLWEIVDDVRHDADAITEKFGVSPAQMIDYQSLVGDPVDDVPGVPGIGAKTASKLLQHFGSVDELLSRLTELDSKHWRGGKRLAAVLNAHQEHIYLARDLVKLEDQIPMRVSANDLAWQPAARKTLMRYLEHIGLSGRIQRTVLRSPVMSGDPV
ncbi:MAG: 5'-3' exonuclease H3TH domain-containing protein [Pseudomonadales bacterium]